ncbi:hypothetical protein H6P81_002150 [Aristolochia fimbriata]|uniref:Uncharacterized protein n=1 Tax=Aristolochia fimbriata TaxID=158543 RepID=A0AAV7F912_ARIFI|nr:hypothetical protein H6P81_002150 [Aristolochia fimbriata]
MDYCEMNNQLAFTLGWDLQYPFGALVLQNPLLDSEYSSSGYLQDAITGNPCKRRRVQLFHDRDQMEDDPDDFLQSCWNLNYPDEELADYSSITLSEDSRDSSICSIINVDKTPIAAAITTKTEEEEATPEQGNVSSSSSSRKSTPTSTGAKDEKPASTDDSADPLPSSARPDIDNRRKKIVYPFAWVKPGGAEGDVTLSEINARILRRPNRPVRHPIGEFACLPFCSDPHGPGLSGKSVVALTRVHTQGSGTITIIRTRGLGFWSGEGQP